VQLAEKSLTPTKADLEWLKEEPKHQNYFPEAHERLDERVREIKFGPGVRALLISASMGLGKSYQMRHYIQKHNPKRVCVLTARRQQAHTGLGLLQDLGFVHYGSVSGQLGQVNRLIVQVESMYRLLAFQGAIEPFDLLILDEARSIIGQTCSPTNGDLLQQNASLFLALLKHTPRVLLMDEDLEADGVVKELVDQVWPTTDTRQILRYTHVALPRSLETLSADKWYACVLAALRRGERVMCPFRTKKRMNDFICQVTAHLPTCKHLVFSGDTVESEMQDFHHIDRVLEENAIQLLSFTSRVTVGADIQRLFDQVFVNAQGIGGCSARDILQMTGRARNLRDPVIKVTLPPSSSSSSSEPSFEQYFTQILEMKQRRKDFLATVKTFSSAQTGWPGLQPGSPASSRGHEWNGTETSPERCTNSHRPNK
jgi:hypothetical protein